MSVVPELSVSDRRSYLQQPGEAQLSNLVIGPSIGTRNEVVGGGVRPYESEGVGFAEDFFDEVFGFAALETVGISAARLFPKAIMFGASFLTT